jgi:shikimate kinase
MLLAEEDVSRQGAKSQRKLQLRTLLGPPLKAWKLVCMDRRIVIVGFMGCGKTTVAAALAARLGCAMVDLDSFITESEGRSPAEVIEQDGEDAFRSIETHALKNVLEKDSVRVIALGGGAWTIEANRQLVAQHDSVSVWLDMPFELCWKRIEAGAAVRPLAPDRESARKLYESRRDSYELAALRIEATEDFSPQMIANEIELHLAPYPKR